MTEKLIQTKGLAFSPHNIKAVVLGGTLYSNNAAPVILIQYHDCSRLDSDSFANAGDAEAERQRLIDEINAASEPPALSPPLHYATVTPDQHGPGHYVKGPNGILFATGDPALAQAVMEVANDAYTAGRNLSYSPPPLPDEPSNEVLVDMGVVLTQAPAEIEDVELLRRLYRAALAAHKREHGA